MMIDLMLRCRSELRLSREYIDRTQVMLSTTWFIIYSTWLLASDSTTIHAINIDAMTLYAITTYAIII